jgi:hypothetical protein
MAYELEKYQSKIETEFAEQQQKHLDDILLDGILFSSSLIRNKNDEFTKPNPRILYEQQQEEAREYARILYEQQQQNIEENKKWFIENKMWLSLSDVNFLLDCTINKIGLDCLDKYNISYNYSTEINKYEYNLLSLSQDRYLDFITEALEYATNKETIMLALKETHIKKWFKDNNMILELADVLEWRNMLGNVFSDKYKFYAQSTYEDYLALCLSQQEAVFVEDFKKKILATQETRQREKQEEEQRKKREAEQWKREMEEARRKEENKGTAGIVAFILLIIVMIGLMILGNVK